MSNKVKMEKMSERLSELRDRMADLKRAIEQWERWGFDSSEGHEWLDEFKVQENEILAWMDEHKK